MNRQEVINTAYTGLKAQNWKKSIQAQGGLCQYRGPNGLKCAIGHLMLDGEYDPFFEDNQIRQILAPDTNAISCQVDMSEKVRAKVDAFITRLDIQGKDDIEFLANLQIIHDESCNDMRKVFVSFVNTKGLTIGDE